MPVTLIVFLTYSCVSLCSRDQNTKPTFLFAVLGFQSMCKLSASSGASGRQMSSRQTICVCSICPGGCTGNPHPPPRPPSSFSLPLPPPLPQSSFSFPPPTPPSPSSTLLLFSKGKISLWTVIQQQRAAQLIAGTALPPTWCLALVAPLINRRLQLRHRGSVTCITPKAGARPCCRVKNSLLFLLLS